MDSTSVAEDAGLQPRRTTKPRDVLGRPYIINALRNFLGTLMAGLLLFPAVVYAALYMPAHQNNSYFGLGFIFCLIGAPIWLFILAASVVDLIFGLRRSRTYRMAASGIASGQINPDWVVRDKRFINVCMVEESGERRIYIDGDVFGLDRVIAAKPIEKDKQHFVQIETAVKEAPLRWVAVDDWQAAETAAYRLNKAVGAQPDTSPSPDAKT